MLSANPTKWSNTLKQFLGKLSTNRLSVIEHFVGLALKGLKSFIIMICTISQSFSFLFTRVDLRSACAHQCSLVLFLFTLLVFTCVCLCFTRVHLRSTHVLFILESCSLLFCSLSLVNTCVLLVFTRFHLFSFVFNQCATLAQICFEAVFIF